MVLGAVGSHSRTAPSTGAREAEQALASLLESKLLSRE
jgi:hypothetical protein